MKTILEIVQQIQDGNINTGNIVHIHCDDTMSTSNKFNTYNNNKALDIHIGFNTINATEQQLIERVTSAMQFSVALRAKYFPRSAQ